MAKESNSFSKEVTAETKIGLGVLAGVAFLGAVSAVYLLGTQEGKNHRKSAGKWMDDLKNDIKAQLKKLQKVDKKVYLRVIDDVADHYKHMEDVDAREIISFAKEIKRQYETIKKEIEQAEGSQKSIKKKSSVKKPTRRKNTKTNSSKTKKSPKTTGRKITASAKKSL